jgi:hypothetical protein
LVNSLIADQETRNAAAKEAPKPLAEPQHPICGNIPGRNQPFYGTRVGEGTPAVLARACQAARIASEVAPEPSGFQPGGPKT